MSVRRRNKEYSEDALRVRLPYNGWTERPYQEKLWDYLCAGGKRALAIWARRSGKDEVALHYSAIAMHKRVCNVWHCMPEYLQGRKAIWNAVNPHTGKRRIDECFPLELRESTNDGQMFIRFKNGSTWQIIGGDRYDKTVGSSPAGIVFSEYALSNPAAWGYFQPILAENNGWALFITTPRGRNHVFDMAKYASQADDWFYEKLTVNDTGAMSREQQAVVLAEYVALYGADAGQAQFKQEYLCDFQAAILGAFYASEMAAVRDEGRVLEIEAIPSQPVHRSWDLGVRDSTAIWFFQVVGTQVFVLDYYVASGVGLEHYADTIVERYRQYKWTHGNDYVPHDAKVRELGTGRTRVETMKRLGLAPILAPDETLLDGINAARRTLPMCVFHPRCESGIAALEQYHREWDSDLKCFKPNPLHDWTSDGADSFRYMALSWRQAPARIIQVPEQTGWRIPPPEEGRKSGLRL